jgi:microcystin-dependent protein
MPLKNGKTTASLQTTLVGSVIPPGTIAPFGGGTVPAGWLLCDGTAISRTTYSALFSAISTTYGVGDNSTTFGLPDYRGRVPAGKDDMGGSAANRLTAAGAGITGTTLGASGGAQTHTLSETQLASHTHIQNSHIHNESIALSIAAVDLDLYKSGYINSSTRASTIPGISSSNQRRGTVEATTPTNQTTGSGSSHQNTQPTIIANYIIKV